MKISNFNLIHRAIAGSLMLLASAFSVYGNTTETVEQAKGTVSLTADVDYVITSATPFASGAVVDIVNTEKATIILKAVKPSKVSSFYGNIRINGVKASAANCQARIHGDGAIILPYNATAPLTVFTEKDQQGESAKFNVSTRQTLKNHAMNNRIQSFTLKRGYMAWFATKADGMGYNRVFIADKGPLTINLPTILSKSISSLRVSQWNDASKKGFCTWQSQPNELLNTTWHYHWDAGYNPSTDREYVTQHHHEGWPGIADVGNNGTSANILGNNEPENTGDPKEQVVSVAQVLATWPEMMATGRRLGSPAVAGNYQWLYEFIDSIDARGWRCDFIAVHAYWYSDWSSWQSQLAGIRNRTGRPIWITEMNYGADWTGWPGSNTEANDANYAIHKQHFAPIIDGLENTSWLERYCVFGAGSTGHMGQGCRWVLDKEGKLTPSGEYYAKKPSNIAYDSRYEYVPKLPKMYKPSQLKLTFDGKVAKIEWYEPNGEYNESMKIQRTADGNKWETIADIEFEEDGADYTYIDSSAVAGYSYRLQVVDAAGQSYITRSVKAVSNTVETGMAMQIDGNVYYAGGNRFVNGDFDLGFMSWTAGDGTPLAEPYFQIVPAGGFNGGAYLQAYADGGTAKPQSVLKVIDIEPAADYYFAGASTCSGLSLQRLCATRGENKEDSVLASLTNKTMLQMESATFNSGTFSKAQLSLRLLSANAQFDNLMLCRLFPTAAEAYADGLLQAQKKAQEIAAYIENNYPGMAAELRDAIKTDVTDCEAEYIAFNDIVENIVKAIKGKRVIDSLLVSANNVVTFGLPGCFELQAAIDAADKCSVSSDYIDALEALQKAMETYMPFVEATIKPQNNNFSNGDKNWEVKCGTFKGGDQRVATHGTKTAWNAWWSGINASEGKAKTMEIRQEVKGSFGHGLYILECKAATQHFCLSDQHAYMVHKGDTAVSPALTADYLDLPFSNEADQWQTLRTKPVYLSDVDTVTIGFVGSKQGATDNKWKKLGDKASTGDKREGWWCATDFVLRYSPLYRVNAPEGGWGVICLPRAYTAQQGTQLYKVAGITADFKYLCLETTDGADAGEPCVYYTTESVIDFYETGDAVKTAGTDAANLRGNFTSTLRARNGSYVIVNGEWQRVNSSFRPYMEFYSGILLKTVGLPVVDSWAGKTMPIYGADQEQADGIEDIEAADSSNATVYDLGGRKTGNQAKGVLLKANGEKVRKVIGK